MKPLAPIVLFVYNRLWHTQQTVEALQKNELSAQSELFIYADGAKIHETVAKVNEVRSYIKSISGFKNITIIERDKNWGLADNIVDGVTKIVNEYGKIIVLEDDIVTSKGFLKYMNDGLAIYQNDTRVMHIASFIPKSSYSFILPDTFFLSFMSCWGWATWKSSWSKFEPNANFLWNQINMPHKLKKFNLNNSINFHEQLEANINGEIHTWAIKWFASIFINNGLCLYPKKSLSINIGQDGTGQNYTKSILSKTSAELSKVNPKTRHIKVKESSIGLWYLHNYYKNLNKAKLSKRIYYFLYSIKQMFIR